MPRPATGKWALWSLLAAVGLWAVAGAIHEPCLLKERGEQLSTLAARRGGIVTAVVLLGMLFLLALLLLCVRDAPEAMQHAQHEQRREQGCCVQCGYDLRTTPERCPECGTQVPPAAPARSKT